jgi:hypothetical protein
VTPKTVTQHVIENVTLDANGNVAKPTKVDVDHKAPLKHPLVIALGAAIDRQFRSAKGKHVRPSLDGPYLDLVVSQACAPRALRVMDAILLAFQARGYIVEIASPSAIVHYHEQAGFQTNVVINDEVVRFHVEELFNGPPPTNADGRRGRMIQYARGHFSPVGEKGKLALAIDSHAHSSERRVWRDRDKKRVEDYLGDFSSPSNG